MVEQQAVDHGPLGQEDGIGAELARAAAHDIGERTSSPLMSRASRK